MYHVLCHNTCAQRVQQAALNLNNFSASIHFIYFHILYIFTFSSGEISEGVPGRMCKTETSPKLLPSDLCDPQVLQMASDRDRVKAVSKEQSKVRWILPRPRILSITRVDHSPQDSYVQCAATISPHVSGTDTGSSFWISQCFFIKYRHRNCCCPPAP